MWCSIVHFRRRRFLPGLSLSLFLFLSVSLSLPAEDDLVRREEISTILISSDKKAALHVGDASNRFSAAIFYSNTGAEHSQPVEDIWTSSITIWCTM